MTPYNEQSRLTMKLQYFTRQFFSKLLFGGGASESPARGDTKIVLTPLGQPWGLLWRVNTPTPPIREWGPRIIETNR